MRARSLSPTSTSCLPILDSSLSHLLGFLGIDEQTKYLSPPMYEPVVVVCTLASSITYSILPPISCQLSKWEVPTLSSSSSLLLVHMCTTPTTPNVYSVKKKDQVCHQISVLDKFLITSRRNHHCIRGNLIWSIFILFYLGAFPLTYKNGIQM